MKRARDCIGTITSRYLRCPLTERKTICYACVLCGLGISLCVSNFDVYMNGAGWARGTGCMEGGIVVVSLWYSEQKTFFQNIFLSHIFDLLQIKTLNETLNWWKEHSLMAIYLTCLVNVFLLFFWKFSYQNDESPKTIINDAFVSLRIAHICKHVMLRPLE